MKRKTKHTLGRELRTLLRVLSHQLHQPAGIHIGLTREANMDLVALAVHLRYTDALTLQAEACCSQEMLNADRQFVVAIFELGPDLAQPNFVLSTGNLLVDAQPLVLLLDVVLVDAQTDPKVKLRGCPLR